MIINSSYVIKSYFCLKLPEMLRSYSLCDFEFGIYMLRTRALEPLSGNMDRITSHIESFLFKMSRTA